MADIDALQSAEHSGSGNCLLMFDRSKNKLEEIMSNNGRRTLTLDQARQSAKIYKNAYTDKVMICNTGDNSQMKQVEPEKLLARLESQSKTEDGSDKHVEACVIITTPEVAVNHIIGKFIDIKLFADIGIRLADKATEELLSYDDNEQCQHLVRAMKKLIDECDALLSCTMPLYPYKCKTPCAEKLMESSKH
ncbi:MAG TPA: hypothetical protein VLH56_10220 [Dissulfurispiraceae bacterium]|nr:hypothetical protein [Dissulfurispiraceae bacterium]